MGLLDFLSLNKSAPDLTSAYTAIMALARQPDHYGDGGVPDSFDGRFDMLAAHVHVVLRRLRSEGVARDDIGFILAVPKHCRCAGFFSEGGQNIRRFAIAINQPTAARPKRCIKFGQRGITPPQTHCSGRTTG